MALVASRPTMTREHLLRAAGTAIHRRRRAALVAAAFRSRRAHPYLRRSRVARLCGGALCRRDRRCRAYLTRRSRSWRASCCEPGEHDSFFHPTVSDEVGTLFEHCARALDASLQVGGHGLPLMGTGDWNDGMNRVGEHGEGESVGSAGFSTRRSTAFAPLAEARRDTARAAAWRTHARALQAALEREAWDGGWYRRAFFDDGTPLGSAAEEECRIDSISQSWAVISGAADPSARHAPWPPSNAN